MKLTCLTSKRKYFREKQQKGGDFASKTKTNTKRSDHPRKNAVYQLGFSLFPLIFPPFLGIDRLENVSMRYQYPEVLGYRVLGIGIDLALVEVPASQIHSHVLISTMIIVNIPYTYTL